MIFPTQAASDYKFWEADFYLTDPQAVTNFISVTVALIAAGFSIPSAKP